MSWIAKATLNKSAAAECDLAPGNAGSVQMTVPFVWHRPYPTPFYSAVCSAQRGRTSKA